jgi:UDP-2,3-diacylglucosamine pyrophosphatase LpxH
VDHGTPHPAPRTAHDPVLYVAGDVHLDGSENAFPRFLDHLATRPAAHLVLLGDLFDYWLETRKMAAMHEPVLARLRRLRDAGWRLDLVLGNREFFAAGRLLAVRGGVRLHWPRIDVTLAGRVLRIVHGDRLCHDPGYRAFAACVRSFWWRGWYPTFPEVVQDLAARFIRGCSRAKQHRRRARPPGARPAVFIDRRKVQGSARGCDTLIAGHIHQSWRRVVGGVDLILVGDWPRGDGHWVEGFADGRLERRRWNAD